MINIGFSILKYLSTFYNPIRISNPTNPKKVSKLKCFSMNLKKNFRKSTGLRTVKIVTITVTATFIKCLLHTKLMNYLFESHNNPMALDIITLLLFPFYRGKNKNPE